jgi:predicted AAA+ superfamily ATPase
MKRDAEKCLVDWKGRTERHPLLVRGARQTGKSYLVENFGNTYFANTVVANFEFKPALKECFTTLDPDEIVNKLQLMLGTQIKDEETLLFLDEIQECPQAIVSLRYFKEKRPRLAVIGAGSLLEFALKKENFKMPVGRVEFLYLTPLSFSEFLDAGGNTNLREFLAGLKVTDKVEPPIHQKLIDLLRLYFLLGGMPAVLNEYFSSKNIVNCQRAQSSILQTFRGDFAKYSKTVQHKYLEKAFDAAPRLVGQRVKYVNIDTEMRSRDLKNALDMLSLAAIIKKVIHSSSSGVPLGAQTDENKFKINFLDVGLVQNACGLAIDINTNKDLLQINAGAVAEQFVGQEICANNDKFQPANLYFWARDTRSSSAEVDYVISTGPAIFPIEVKAGKTGRLRSLKLFMEEKKTRFGIRISQEPLSFYDDILSLPLYMIEHCARFVEEIRARNSTSS